MRGGWVLLLSGPVLTAACGLPGPAPDSPLWERRRDEPWTVRADLPSLEDVFLEPGIHGEPPEVAALSPDGRHLLYRHRALELVVDDEGGDEARRGRFRLAEGPALRLLTLGNLARPPRPAQLVAEFLPPEEDREVPRDPKAVWTEDGERLVLVRGREVYLLTPGKDRALLLVGADAAPWKRDLTTLEIVPDTRDLRVSDGRRSWRLPLADRGRWFEPGLSVDAPRLEGLRLLAPESELAWSDDRRTVFHPGGALLRPLGVAPSRAPLAALLGARLPWQVLHLPANAWIDLEGRAAMRWCENEELSPDGRWVVATEVDRRLDPPPTDVPDYLTERVSERSARSRWADDGPAPTRVWVWNTLDGTRRQLAFPEPFPGWLQVVGWAPQPYANSPARCVVGRWSTDWRSYELWCWTPEAIGTTGGRFELVFEERDEKWVGGRARRPRFTPDGRHLVVGSECRAGSTTPGRTQLFTVDLGTGRVSQLTEVKGEVSGFVLDSEGGLALTYSLDDPAERYVGRLSPAAVRGDAPAQLYDPPQPRGWNEDLVLSADGNTLVFAHERLFQPSELWATRTDPDEIRPSRRLTKTIPKVFEETQWILPVRFRDARAADGTPLSAHVFLPPETSLDAPDAPRACIVFVHGAGYLQNVTESMTQYAVNLLFHSRLAALGYVVVDVDYRGSAGYGNAFRTDVQYHMGGKDLSDIHAVVDALARRGVIDGRRAGIYGGSYGGFLTLMALFTAPERWAVGCALRSVTDWRTYNPWYTQRRLGRPTTHPDAYERSSPIDHVDGLEDPLLVLHGMVDTNVFAQDSIRLIEELIDRGKEFDAMLYPSQGHAFDEGAAWVDEYRRIERYLVEHLGPPVYGFYVETPPDGR